MDPKKFVSCSDGHPEIFFEGFFSALCPMCSALTEAAVELKLTQERDEKLKEAIKDIDVALDSVDSIIYGDI